MKRHQLTFECEGAMLAATSDPADGTTGLLIVSGGNELRSGAFAGQARIAEEISKHGFPVFRFDRRGVGDSEGANRGFEHSAVDIEAALSAFHATNPRVSKVVAFGNCDAASALMLQGGAGFDALILSNPWTFDADSDDGAMPADAIRSRYADKLRNPAEIKRLLSGGVSLSKLFGGLKQALGGGSEEPSGLAQKIRAGLGNYAGDVRILVAEKDRTAQAFLSSWEKDDPRISRCAGASHAYVEPDAFAWLTAQILAVLAQE